MKKCLVVMIATAFLSIGVLAQSKAGSFPGVSSAQLTQLRGIKKTTPMVLPTWLPAGFKLEKIHSKLGRGVKVYEKEFTLIYSRTLDSGQIQRFALNAGFDGLGDLMYEGAKTLKTPIGTIYLLYEPKDPDNGNQKMENYVMTEWFGVGGLSYHYIGMYGYEDGDEIQAMISLADTEKILRSLKRL